MNILHLSPCQGAFGGIEAFVLAVADQLHREGNKVEVLFKKVVGFKLQESLQQALSGREYSISFQNVETFEPLLEKFNGLILSMDTTPCSKQ